MPSSRPDIVRGLLGVACVLVVGFQAFSLSATAGASRDVVSSATRAAPTAKMPTARDLTIFERRMRKANRDSRFAETCGRGHLLGNTEVHVAMSFPLTDGSGTEERPAIARVHVAHQGGTPKAVVLESKVPTLWTVTGSPDVIVATGKSVVAEYPAETPIFAPLISEACGKADWANLPRHWAFPDGEDGMLVVDDVKGPFQGRADFIAKRLFDRTATKWKVQRGHRVIEF